MPSFRGAVGSARSPHALLVGLLLLLPRLAAAQDAFEIQVYDAETARPGEFGLETHVNHFFTDDLTHLTFEPHLGLTSWWEVGVYLQFAMPPSGVWTTGGFKLRTKFRLLDPVGPFRFALNIELARVSKLYEPDGWGGELRPIVDARWGPLYVAVNPIISFSFAGPDAWKPVLEPAYKISVDVAGPVALGLELYSDYGVIGEWLPPSLQTHRLFVVTDVVLGNVAFNLGVGRNLSGPESWVVKLIFAISPPADEPAVAAQR